MKILYLYERTWFNDFLEITSNCKTDYFWLDILYVKCSLIQAEQFWHSAKKTKVHRGDKKLDYNVELSIGDLQLAFVNRFLWDITVRQQQEYYIWFKFVFFLWGVVHSSGRLSMDELCRVRSLNLGSIRFNLNCRLARWMHNFKFFIFFFIWLIYTVIPLHCIR